MRVAETEAHTSALDHKVSSLRHRQGFPVLTQRPRFSMYIIARSGRTEFLKLRDKERVLSSQHPISESVTFYIVRDNS